MDRLLGQDEDGRPIPFDDAQMRLAVDLIHSAHPASRFSLFGIIRDQAGEVWDLELVGHGLQLGELLLRNRVLLIEMFVTLEIGLGRWQKRLPLAIHKSQLRVLEVQPAGSVRKPYLQAASVPDHWCQAE